MAQNQHILCLAGAGSGKTRVLTTRVFYLVNKLGVEPENILTITFTKNAATEMVERLGALSIDTDQLWCRTFHSACYKILQESSSSSRLNIISEATQSQLLRRSITNLRRQPEFGYKLARFLEENNWPIYLFHEEIAKIIHECKNYSVSPSDLIKKCQLEKDEDILEFYRLFYIIFSTYQNYLADHKLFDFSDLISKAITILERNKKILKRYQRKFCYILVDEFQDVNYGQIRLLNILKGQSNNLFAVGDDWQAIYGWRGGDVKYILQFKKNYQSSCRTITLPFNYRSDSNIVRAASKCIGRNHRQCRKKIKSFHPATHKIKIFRGKDSESCHKFVLEKIAALIQSGVSSDDIMILGRNWKHVNFFIEQLHEKKSAKYQAINITTIHGAKGLECDFVFLVGLHRGRGGFPNIKEDPEIKKIIKATTRSERLAEERRCFYVAITRAKKELYLITEKDNESIFIKEVPKRFCQEIKKERN